MTSMWASTWWRLTARRWAAGSGRTGVDLGGAEVDGRLATDGGGRTTSLPGGRAAASWLEAGEPPAELGEWRRVGHWSGQVERQTL